MYFGNYLVRQAMLAALICLPLPAIADVVARFDSTSGNLVVTGLKQETRRLLILGRKPVDLKLKGQTSKKSMPVTLVEDSIGLIVDPRFSLRPGTQYTLSLNDMKFEVSVPAPASIIPRLVSFAPSQAIIPANTLRIYLSFSEPMARGQLRD